MILMFLGFATVFAALFGLMVVIDRWWTEAKEIRALDERQRKMVEAENEAAWHRNRQMTMR
jgi:hypothetical protein